MKAMPMKGPPGEGFVPCQPDEATHVQLAMPGPLTTRLLPVILKGSRRDHQGPVWTREADAQAEHS